MSNPAADVSRLIAGRTNIGDIQLVDWLNMNEDQWEEFAEQHLEPLIAVGASPCPVGLVFRGMLIIPTGTENGAVIFTCFAEPDWQAGQVIRWNGATANAPDEVELVEIAASLEALLS